MSIRLCVCVRCASRIETLFKRRQGSVDLYSIYNCIVYGHMSDPSLCVSVRCILRIENMFKRRLGYVDLHSL